MTLEKTTETAQKPQILRCFRCDKRISGKVKFIDVPEFDAVLCDWCGKWISPATVKLLRERGKRLQKALD